MPADQPTAPEIWKPIPSLNGLYEASTLGRIRSAEQLVLVGGVLAATFPPYVLKPRANTTTGYPSVGVRKKIGQVTGGRRTAGGDKQYTCSVHTLVAEAFHGPRPAGMDVNHKNGDKADAHPENLEYMSRSDNLRHAYKMLGNKRAIGTRRRIPDAVVVALRAEYATGTVSKRTLAKRSGFSEGWVYDVLNGKRR